MRLQQEGLEFRDLPDVDDQEFPRLLSELGFGSALERTKLRRAVRDLRALRSPSDAKRSVATLSTAADDEVASQVSSEFVPVLGAYYTGERVEFFCRRLHLWILAEVTVEPQTASGDMVYSATVLPQRREYYNVGLGSLRPPLQEGEPCEVLSASGAWLPAVVASGQLGGGEGEALSYGVALLERAGGEVRVPASALRRRFPAGSLVSVYQGPGAGWCNGMVVAFGGAEGGADNPPTVDHDCLPRTPGRGTAAAELRLPGLASPERGGPGPEWSTEVAVCLEAHDTVGHLQRVPSSVVRFRAEYLDQYHLWGPPREEAAGAECGNLQSALLKQDSFAIAPLGSATV